MADARFLGWMGKNDTSWEDLDDYADDDLEEVSAEIGISVNEIKAIRHKRPSAQHHAPNTPRGGPQAVIRTPNTQHGGPQALPMCANCHTNKVWVDKKRGPTNYCSKTCRNAIAGRRPNQSGYPHQAPMNTYPGAHQSGHQGPHQGGHQYAPPGGRGFGPQGFANPRGYAGPSGYGRGRGGYTAPPPDDGMCQHCGTKPVYQGGGAPSKFCSIRCRDQSAAGAPRPHPSHQGRREPTEVKGGNMCLVCHKKPRYINDKNEESPCCGKSCLRKMSEADKKDMTICAKPDCKKITYPGSEYCTTKHMKEHADLLKKSIEDYETKDADLKKKMKELEKKAKEGSAALPPYWPDISPAVFKEVKLSPSSKEYKDVSTRFLQTATTMKVVEIHLVVNLKQWRVFCGVRQSFEVNLGKSKVNELQAFHGSKVDVIKLIKIQGFQRDFNSASASGKGVYFARDSSYSCSTRYSPRDSNGHGRMFLARVLCGEWVQGNSSYKRPPMKPGKANEEYETMVNDPANPSVYVTCQDFQAYPEFCITFKD